MTGNSRGTGQRTETVRRQQWKWGIIGHRARTGTRNAVGLVLAPTEPGGIPFSNRFESAEAALQIATVPWGTAETLNTCGEAALRYQRCSDKVGKDIDLRHFILSPMLTQPRDIPRFRFSLGKPHAKKN